MIRGRRSADFFIFPSPSIGPESPDFLRSPDNAPPSRSPFDEVGEANGERLGGVWPCRHGFRLLEFDHDPPIRGQARCEEKDRNATVACPDERIG